MFKEKINNNVGVNKIYDFINEHQPIKANIISANFPHVTQRTVERYIKELKENNKIEFRGSSKTGGYYVT